MSACLVSGVLVVPWWTHKSCQPQLDSPDLGEVAAGLGKAETSVRATSHYVGVVVVLPVVLPEAHRTDVVDAALGQGEIAAAWTAHRAAWLGVAQGLVFLEIVHTTHRVMTVSGVAA